MSWYLKKAFQFGPIRLNLSKSGIGVSAGVKGFRVGTGPRGPYVHAGRGGIYYRKSLDDTEGDSPHTSAGPREGTAAASPPKSRAIYSILVFLSVTVVTLLVSLGMSETFVVTAATALFVICVVVVILERRRQPPKPPQVPPDQF
jgi:DNA polymerase III subunit epsilon